MFCSKCAIDGHMDHRKTIIDITQEGLEQYLIKTLEKLNVLKNKIQLVWDALSKFKSKKKSLLSCEFMELVSETKDILFQPLLKT